ncbi:RNA polymerase sigma factor [Pseudogemmobacter sonorensis]|uniref:RNA polymerase sigma factor n=1 Tax=Pseudogemmobacter sonorensis TaxID=2989681 RepID=UPI0036CE3592
MTPPPPANVPAVPATAPGGGRGKAQARKQAQKAPQAQGDAPPLDPRDRIPAALPGLRAFAIGLSRNPSTADDLVQETILKAWSNIDKFDPATNLEAWLFTILRNTFYSSLRKTRREVADSDGSYAATMFERPAHDGRLAFGDFQRAFDQLSPEHREVLILIGASGYSCEEAAEMIGVATGTVKSRASRARKRLGELLHLAEGEDILATPDGATAAVLSRSGIAAA